MVTASKFKNRVYTEEELVKLKNNFVGFYQKDNQIRWFVQIAENRAYAIQLMADGANLSTLLHELGHVALNELN